MGRVLDHWMKGPRSKDDGQEPQSMREVLDIVSQEIEESEGNGGLGSHGLVKR